jgi:small subunit ribosomal protein S2
MAPYVYGKRNAIHIIDIRETVKGLVRAKRFLTQVVMNGKDVIFVGTKRQAKHHVRQLAMQIGMPYVSERWLGGTLTNFATIRSRLVRLDELERQEADGTLMEYSKKMISSRTRELRKIRRNLDGIRNMTKVPGAMVVIDAHRERNAVREARKLNVPTVCLIDTDSDPDYADVPIPGNDDAMRSIELVLQHLADAVAEGLKGRQAAREAEPESSGNEHQRPAQRPARRFTPKAARVSGGPVINTAPDDGETDGGLTPASLAQQKDSA